MAGYDPKRPRPDAGGDEPAPVEALLDPEPSDRPEPTDRPDQDVEGAADPDVIAPVPASVSEPVDAPGEAEPVDRHLRAVAASDSTVPVADRPPEPAANRAVAFVGIGVGAAAVTALLLLLLLRRRRR